MSDCDFNSKLSQYKEVFSVQSSASSGGGPKLMTYSSDLDEQVESTREANFTNSNSSSHSNKFASPFDTDVGAQTAAVDRVLSNLHKE